MLKTPCIFTLFVLLFSISFSQCISGDCQIGFGTFKHTNGSIYIGEWWNGEMNGEGTLIWPDGPIYIGEFKNGLYHGNGTYLESYQDGVKLYINHS